MHKISKMLTHATGWQEHNDKIIVDELTKMCREIEERYKELGHAVKDIMGLSESQEECEHDFNYGHKTISNQCRKCKQWFPIKDEKPSEKKECDHVNYPEISRDWNFCPLCGAKLIPVTKSLADKFHNLRMNESGSIYYLTRDNAEVLEEIAEKHFAELGFDKPSGGSGV